MMNVIERPWVRACFTALIIVTGCGDGSGVTSTAVGPKVKVIYQGNPLADVQVSVHLDKTSMKPVMQGISNAEGVVVLLPIGDKAVSIGEAPIGNDTMMPVTLQSFGDGGWILDPKLSELARTPLSVRVSYSEPPPVVEIPRDGVRPL